MCAIVYRFGSDTKLLLAGIIDVTTDGIFKLGSARKKRQIPGNVTNCTSSDEACESYPPKFEDLTFTDAQRLFCNNIKTCLYDLVVTKSEEFANVTKNFDTEKTLTTEILSKFDSIFIGWANFYVILTILQ